MLVAGVLLITLATARFVVDVTYLFVVFIHRDTREARLAFLENVTDELFIAKHALFITSLQVGDLFVVCHSPPRILLRCCHDSYSYCWGLPQNYRCWVVWGKNTWIVVIPITLSIFAAGKSLSLIAPNLEPF